MALTVPSTDCAAAAPPSGFARLPFSTETEGTNGGRFTCEKMMFPSGLS